MPSGRPRKPTTLKIIQGTLEKSRVLENEFEPESVETLEPTFLQTEYELNEFEKITGELSKYGLLAEIDLSLIESYCIEYGKYREAIEMLRKEGLTKNGKMGEYINPHHMIAERSFDRMYKLGVMFGLTPAGRTKVQVKKKQNKGLDSILNGTGT